MEKRVQRSRSVVARQPIIADGRAITPLTSYTRSRDLASIGLLYTTSRERLAGGSGVAQKAEPSGRGSGTIARVRRAVRRLTEPSLGGREIGYPQ